MKKKPNLTVTNKCIKNMITVLIENNKMLYI